MLTWWRLTRFYRRGGAPWRNAMGRAFDKVTADVFGPLRLPRP